MWVSCWALLWAGFRGSCWAYFGLVTPGSFSMTQRQIYARVISPSPGLRTNRKSTSDPWIFSLCSFCELYSAGTIFGPSWGPPQAGRDGPGPLRLCFRTLFGGSWTCLDVFNKEGNIRILVRFQTGMAQLGGVPPKPVLRGFWASSGGSWGLSGGVAFGGVLDMPGCLQ